jgi:DNA-directed RNA polymerase sigma subunit (sigma70/sigma32)
METGGGEDRRGTGSVKGGTPMIAVDTLTQYQREIRALRAQVQEADAAQYHLVEMHLPLVIALARRYEGRGVDLLDLIQESNLGLLRAAQKYDPSLGVKFSTCPVKGRMRSQAVAV